jgi:hypothetical protein
MLPYNPGLKPPARSLRRTMTDAERLLWSRVRGKQIGPVQFYRQKPLGGYIVDFQAPKAKLVIEVDGSPHREPENFAKDRKRDADWSFENRRRRCLKRFLTRLASIRAWFSKRSRRVSSGVCMVLAFRWADRGGRAPRCPGKVSG